jgi:hypothetical protein
MFLYLNVLFYFVRVNLKIAQFVILMFLENVEIFLTIRIIFYILSCIICYLNLNHLFLIIHIYHRAYYQEILNKFNKQ